MMPRSEFSRKVRAAIIERANGHCEECKAAIKGTAFEIDHILPCALGGNNRPSNAMLICTVCHKAKTKTDVQKTRKADRAKDKESGAWVGRARAKLRGCGFEKTHKPAKIDKSALPPLPPRQLYGEVR